jgi:hypothetical protein
MVLDGFNPPRSVSMWGIQNSVRTDRPQIGGVGPVFREYNFYKPFDYISASVVERRQLTMALTADFLSFEGQLGRRGVWSTQRKIIKTSWHHILFCVVVRII